MNVVVRDKLYINAPHDNGLYKAKKRIEHKRKRTYTS